ncbi:hypothetical protein ACVWZ4_002951 [Bradyrhizobium sp. USDA 4472]
MRRRVAKKKTVLSEIRARFGFVEAHILPKMLKSFDFEVICVVPELLDK